MFVLPMWQCQNLTRWSMTTTRCGAWGLGRGNKSMGFEQILRCFNSAKCNVNAILMPCNCHNSCCFVKTWFSSLTWCCFNMFQPGFTCVLTPWYSGGCHKYRFDTFWSCLSWGLVLTLASRMPQIANQKKTRRQICQHHAHRCLKHVKGRALIGVCLWKWVMARMAWSAWCTTIWLSHNLV
jgi:hypothetical protein